MADDSYRKEYPQQSRPEDTHSRPQSHYPPPPDTTQRPSDAPPSSMATSVTLPSIHDSRSYGPPPAAPGRGYPADPRYASPNAVNGYPPPGHQPPPGQPQQYLPPLQPQSDPRSSAYPPPPPDQRGYYDDRRPPYGQEAYSTEPYYAYYRGQPPPPGPPPPNGHPGYRHIPAGVYEYPIRCSGYQSAPGGKCQNCARMNQECIFQPVSSSSSTAFIPVSALPGGVPPGTQLFGAYGQPLAPGTVPAPPPPHAAYQHASAPPPPGNYYAPVQSPTESFSSYGEARTDDGSQLAGRRRRRTSEEQDEGYRLPPPRSAVDEDPRRRSPAEFSNHSSPGGVGYPPYQGARQSPRNPTSGSLPQAATAGSYVASAPGGRSPTGQNGSSGASTPARQGQQSQGGNASIMSLSNLVDKSDIDKTMIERLNRPAPGQPGARRDVSR
ncbi:c6 transcription [Fusarium bulbicola]|uniref:C6 transcription n=2 Tax=Fusarium fujikuroi species complex TaxID=171627 RepID=A0A8H5URR5_GIBSU|nr:c6 transcription [Fusarium subglutinans]KAF5596986.1 c6 transcription [Fusarium subglutinans]KAF5682716.1 c6 transcription [Fusarium circinatum]KAF5982949.1 c6 transcription [Fusarium bulbicola]